MKKATLFRFVVMLLFTFQASILATFAQTPNQFKYQAVLRDEKGNIIASQSKTVIINILQGGLTGTDVFTEMHNVTTTEQGIINLVIGSVNTTGIAQINWSASTYFIKITVEGIEMGTSQLLSVPYALNAKSAETVDFNSIINLPTFNIGNWNSAYSWGNHANAGYLKSFTENDPIFASHLANGITSTLINNWNNAYLWGNHAEAGYLKKFAENDPIFASHPANGITSTLINNWNNAFTWGNHAGLYHPITYVPSWNEVTAKPSFATISTSGSYADLINNPFQFSTPATDQLIKYNGTNWINFTPDFASTNHAHDNATLTTNGFISNTDKTKLDGLQNANIKVDNGLTMSGTYPDITISGITKHYVGELYGGGVIFYVDPTGQHGLICSMINLSTAQAWSNVTTTTIGTTAKSDWNGRGNTNAIVAQSGHTGSAAKLCDNYVNNDYGTGVFSDWYLPTIAQLKKMFDSLYEINRVLETDGVAETTILIKGNHWSSNEYNIYDAYFFTFNIGYSSVANKNAPYYTRAVREF